MTCWKGDGGIKPTAGFHEDQRPADGKADDAEMLTVSTTCGTHDMGFCPTFSKDSLVITTDKTSWVLGTDCVGMFDHCHLRQIGVVLQM